MPSACVCKCDCVVSVRVHVCTYLAVRLRTASYKHWKRTEDWGGVTDSSSQGASIFILFAGNGVWNFDEEQFASLDGCEEVCFVRGHRKSRGPRTAGSKKSAHPIAQRHPPSALHHQPSWHRFPATSASGYSSIVLCGQEHLLGVCSSSFHGIFFFQSDPRAPPQPLHMTEIRQRGGGTDANLHSCETKVVVLRWLHNQSSNPCA